MKVILAVDDKMGIAKDGGIPWDSKNDLRFFRLMTIGETVVMGKKTADSMGSQLKDRKNIVLRSDFPLERLLLGDDDLYHSWLIGGATVLKDALSLGVIDIIYLSRIKGDYECDTFIEIPSDFRLLCTFRLDDLTIEKYRKINELQRNY